MGVIQNDSLWNLMGTCPWESKVDEQGEFIFGKVCASDAEQWVFLGSGKNDSCSIYALEQEALRKWAILLDFTIVFLYLCQNST